jgi:two-component system response regulator HydG
LAKILIIEDNETMRDGMVQILTKMKHTVLQAANGESGIDYVQEKHIDLVVTDYRMTGMNGLEVLKRVKKMKPAIPVMIITAYGSIDLAVQAMQLGAVEFITKPFSHGEFRVKIEKIFQNIDQKNELNRLTDENVYLRTELEGQFNFGEIIGESAKMKRLYSTISKVSRTDSSVIIYGESGTGKELVARAIHKGSDRRSNPFIRVNCGALAEGVLESELFGHEKGAFTGAIKRKRGRFELADSGTIFLDEIGDLPPSTQVKLLRVLQEKEFERVGGEQTLTVNVRVIAATNRDLEKLVADKKFREDLYYRLHIIPIYLPPLRERSDDIPTLADHFLQKIGREIGQPDLKLDKAAVDMLCRYHWPGNVRELENVLERSAVLAEGETITLSDLPLLLSDRRHINTEYDSLDLNDTLARVEKNAIESALKKSNGNKTRAAKLLGIKTSALYYKLEKYGL